eukprot:scaffold218886_cov17-Tisochrysis_lutea.AAC.1
MKTFHTAAMCTHSLHHLHAIACKETVMNKFWRIILFPLLNPLLCSHLYALSNENVREQGSQTGKKHHQDTSGVKKARMCQVGQL